MRKINARDYYARTCPECASKKLRAVSVRYMGREYQVVTGNATRTGYICGNCGRYHNSSNSKFRYDRAQMRRDANNLLKFLRGKKK